MSTLNNFNTIHYYTGIKNNQWINILKQKNKSNNVCHRHYAKTVLSLAYSHQRVYFMFSSRIYTEVIHFTVKSYKKANVKFKKQDNLL